MAYRQYIGARYVPLFDGPWDATKNYEPLTVVEDGNGNSYTSKKDVPAGTPLTDRNYWMLTASFSGAVEQLRRDVTELQGDVSGFQGDITALQGDISGLQDDISGLQDGISGLQDDISAIGQRVDRIAARKFVFLGDSYYLGTSGASLTGRGWAHKCAEYMGLSDDEKIMATASDIINPDGTVSTPAFYPSAGAHKSFASILQIIGNRLDDATRESVTDIVVAGGYNDIGHENQIYQGIQDFVGVRNELFPNAQIHVAEIAYNGAVSISGVNARAAIASRIIPEYAKSVQLGCSYISNAERLLNNATLFDSPAHPNDTGYALIGRAIANALNGGGETYTQDGTFPITAASGAFTIGAGAMSVHCDPYKRKRIESATGITFNPASRRMWNQGEVVEIPINCNGVLPVAGNTFQITVRLYDAQTSNFVAAIPASIRFALDTSGNLIIMLTNLSNQNIAYTAIRIDPLYTDFVDIFTY